MPDLVDQHQRSGSTSEQPRDQARWVVIATLAEADARWPWSSSERVTIPTGFVKSTIQAPSAAPSRTRVGDVEQRRHRAERLPSPPRRSSPADAAAGEWHRLVGEPRLLTPDADLDQHEVGSVDRALEVVRDLQRARRSPGARACARRGRRRPPALLVDVVQHELAHVDAVSLAREARDELRRVRRAAADDAIFIP
jgi:hypothetical protein